MNLKKWNWSIFFVIVLVSCMGALSNKTIPDITSCFIVAGYFGIPVGLFMAWLTQEPK